MGVGRLPVALAEALTEDGVAVRTQTVARSLQRHGDRWRLLTGPAHAPATESARTLDVDGVVLALPAAPAARLLADTGEAGLVAAADLLAGVAYASVALVLLAVRADPDVLAAVAGHSGVLVPPVAGLTVKAVTYSSTKWDWVARAAPDTVLLRASVGRAGESTDLARPDGELVRAVLADLRLLTGVDLAGRVLDARVARWGGGLPQYAPGHVDLVAAVRSAVAGAGGLAVAGAAYDGVGIPACIASGRDAAGSLSP